MNMKSLLSQKGSTVFHIRPDASLNECIAVMNQKRVGALMVIDAYEEIRGIVSERDILRAAGARQCQIGEIPVSQIMTQREKLITAGLEDTVEAVMECMTSNHVRHIPVMESGKLMGLISIGDVVKAHLDMALHENEQMRDYISGRYAM